MHSTKFLFGHFILIFFVEKKGFLLSVFSGWMDTRPAILHPFYVPVFPSYIYKNDGWVLMKDYAIERRLRLKMFPPSAGLEPKIAR